MSNADMRGRFIWHELMTTDPEAAGTFYSKVVPWKTQPSGMPSYTLWMAGKTQTGGLMALPEDSQAGATPPHWLVYIGTPDVDATVAAAERLGGKVLKAASDIPSVGRFAVLADPQGATFAVFTPADPAAPRRSGPPGMGEFTWHELATTDSEAALKFYTELFGWQKGRGHDMGPIGVYQLIEHGGMEVGGIYTAQGASTPSSWLSYVRVQSVDKAAAAAKSAGGRVLNGPMEVPGGSWIAMLLDPQGGAFAVVEEAKAAAAQAKAEPARKSAKARAGAEPAKTAAAEQPKPPAASEPPEAAGSGEAPGAGAPAGTGRAPRRKAPMKAAGKAGRKAPGKAAGKKASGGRMGGRKAAAKSTRGTTGRSARSAAKKRPAAGRAAGKSAGAGRGKAAGKKGTAAAKRGGRGVRAKGRKR